ncbi:DUF4190 domain-containing protein [Streptomyces sp. NPDC052095]|uniref:DUF4190 domain-containing protein n=1 Tax=unclassified Streptomyces TaxID=2593676 RepID=UPI00344C6239
MSDSTERPEGGGAASDPWAPPENRAPLPEDKVQLEKPAAAPQQPAAGDGGSPAPADAPPSPGFGAPAPTAPQPAAGDVPPPPVGPNGPGQQMPPSAGPYGYPAPQPAPYGGYPSYPGYGQTAWGAAPPSNGLGTAAMVLGILAVCLFCVYGIPSLILGTLALIFGILGRKRAKRGEATNSGQALTGIILGSVGIALGVAIISFFVWFIAANIDEYDEDGTYNDDPFATSLVVDAR